MTRFPHRLLHATLLLACLAAGAYARDARPAVTPSPGFVENRGQVVDAAGRPRTDILYTADLGNVRVYFRRDGVSYGVFEALPDPDNASEATLTRARAAHRFRTWRVDVTYLDASPTSLLAPAHPSGARRHHYLAHCADGTVDAAVYDRLVYRDIRPGIDVVWYFTPAGLKYDIIARPHARIDDLAMRIDGARDLRIGDDARLVLSTPLGTMHEDAPTATLAAGGVRRESPVRFALDGDILRVVHEREEDARLLAQSGDGILEVDPCVHWSTYLGGATSDFGRAVAVDAEGKLAVAGYTSSRDFPVSPGALAETNAGQIDVTISQFTADGRLLWSTYFGGSGSDEWPSVAFAPNGDVVVAGFTASGNLPVTGDAMQPMYGGNTDGFVLRLDAKGRRLWATYAGGSYADEAAGVAVDARGNVIVTGATYSTNFPVSSGAVQTSNAGDFDAFLLKLTPAGTRAWATYLGGWSMDYATGVAVLPEGDVVVAGYTEGEAFPTSGSADQSGYAGGAADAFVARFSAAGARRWSTFYGGTDEDKAAAVTVDAAGAISICGNTRSRDLPLRQAAFQKVIAGVRDGFVVRYDVDGARMWDTYLGGNANDQAMALDVAGDGSLFVTGFTESPTFPVTSDAMQLTLGGAADAFLVRFDATGMRTYGTYYGALQSELANGIAVDARGDVVVTGVTSSAALPLFGRSAQRTLAGIDDAFLLRIIFNSVLADAGENTVICTGGSARLGHESRGGFGTVTYEWTPALGLDDATSPTPNASPTRSTFYVLRMRDEAGCESTDTVAVTVLPPLRAEAGADGVVCPGGSLTLGREPVGEETAYTYAWEPAAGLSATDIPQPVAAPTRTTLYRLTVRNQYSCTAVDSVLVTVRDAPVATLPADLMICHGTPRALEVAVTGGTPPYTYAWNPATGLDNATAAAPRADPGAETEYTVTITDAVGCSATARTRVDYHPRLTADAGEDAVSCFGNPVRLSGRVSGGRKPYTWRWSSSISSSEAATQTVQVQPAHTTMYLLTVTDANGCSARDSVLVRVQDRIDVHAGDDVDVCEGEGVVVGREAKGGLAPYTYKWKPETGVSDPRIATPEIRSGTTRAYVVTVIDAAGCAGSDTITVRVLPKPKVFAGRNQMACTGSAVRLGEEARDGTPPYTYAWTPVTGVREPSSAVTDVIATTTTTYTLTVTDARGCSASSQVTLTVEDPPLVSAGRDTSVCIGESVRLTATPAGGRDPYRFEWSPSDVVARPTSPSTDVSPRRRTVFVVRVTDARGCTAVDSVVVDTYEKPTGDAGRDTTVCPDTPALLGASVQGGRAPYSYFWSPATALSDAYVLQPVATPAATTTYTLRVTDANGCETTDAVKITVAPRLEVAAAGPSRLCAGAQAEVSAKARGGIPPYRYAWRTGHSEERGAQPRFVFTASASTVAVIEVTDAVGCIARDSVVIEVPAPLAVAVEGISPVCTGGEVDLRAVVTGGVAPYEIQWSANTPSAARATTRRTARRGAAAPTARGESFTLRPDRTTSLAITVRDAMGCAMQTTATVPVHPVRMPVIAARGAADFCDGDSVVLEATPGFVRYAWSDGGEGPLRVATASAAWTVRATDEHGCETVSSPFQTKKKERPRPEILVKGPARLCAGTRTTLDAGAGHAAYRWSTGATTRTITVAEAGDYDVEVTAKNGCAARSASVRIDVVEVGDAALARRGDTLVASPGATWRWFRDGHYDRKLQGAEVVVTRSGLYRVEVTQESGCTAVSPSLRVRVAPKPRPATPPSKAPRRARTTR
jgi:hypothetical protein